MGITCKQFGKTEGIMRKADNEALKEKRERKRAEKNNQSKQ